MLGEMMSQKWTSKRKAILERIHMATQKQGLENNTIKRRGGK